MDHVLSDASASVSIRDTRVKLFCIQYRYNEKEVAALGTFIDHQRLYMRATEVGKRVRQVREKLRLTQGEFARRLGVTRVSVARYEAGRVPSFGVLHQLARLGGVTVGWLLLETPEEESPRDWGDRLSPLDVPEAATSFLAFLKREAAKIAPLPKDLRKKLEVRLHESIVALERELEEYRELLQRRARASDLGRKRSAKKRQTQ
jgi:transcriptional regulator with XRE-family HTH domain